MEGQPAAQPPTELNAREIINESSKDGVYQCTLCQKKFGYKNGLIRHVRLTHIGEKPYQCNICNRRFGYKHILMEHQNLHFGNRPYACNVCDKRFAARSNLIQHRLVHKKPYNCYLCSKRFDREDQLKKHLFAHPQSMLACNICNYTATSQTDLNQHMVDLHHPQVGKLHLLTRPKSVFNCNVCNYAAGNQSDLTQHMVDQHHPQVMDTRFTTRRESTDNGSAGQNDEEADTRPESISPPVQPQGSPDAIANGDSAVMRRESGDSPRGDFNNVSCPTGRSSVSPAAAGLGMQQAVARPPQMTMPSIPAGVVIKKEIESEGEDENCAQESSPRDNRVRDLVYTNSNQHIGMSGAVSSAPVPRVSSAGSDTSNRPQHSPLPAIHELFSRRPQRVAPTFSNFGTMLPPRVGLAQSEYLPQFIPPFHNTYTTTSMSTPTSPTTGTTTATSNHSPRPTAQLPPIAQVLRHTKETAVQHSDSIPGYPDLDEVLSYYMSQGKLFKCHHCNVLFYERGMYFLHASLHGASNPWECSICHKVCSDKNEFTLHFVNQQHTV